MTLQTQDELPGIESEKIPGIEKAAKKLHEIRTDRMALTQKEVEAATALIAIMQEHGVEVYECKTFEGTVKVKPGKTKVSVKLPSSDDDDDE